MMKKYLFLLLIGVLAFNVSCTKKSETPQVSDEEQIEEIVDTICSVPADTLPLHELSESTCQMLAICIPDHQMSTLARVYFTKDFLNAWDDIRTMPDYAEYAGYIPNNDWVWYFVQSNGGCDLIETRVINKTIINDTIAELKVTYTCVEEGWSIHQNPQVHTISLVWRDDQWLIDDYDGEKQRMSSWVNWNVAHYEQLADSVGIYEWNDDQLTIVVDQANSQRYLRDMERFIERRRR